jgi:uncharacterized membrane protein
MIEPLLRDATHWITLGFEVIGVVIIVIGAAAAAVRFATGRSRAEDRYSGLRSDLGRSVLLGLEFLVAADIIGTVAIEPTLDGVIVLGIIVLIRTFLSFSLETEIEGRWPWQRAAAATPRARSPGAEDEVRSVRE